MLSSGRGEITVGTEATTGERKYQNRRKKRLKIKQGEMRMKTTTISKRQQQQKKVRKRKVLVTA